LSALVLLTLAFIPLSSQQGGGTYDPWIDTNDDGIIDVYDLQAMGSIYGTSGTPINKTDLLLELESRVSALEAAGSVTNIRLAAGAIPFNSIYRLTAEMTTSTSWIDMPSMSISITLNRTSHLLIFFTTMAYVGVQSDFLWVRAIVDGLEADPPRVYLGYAQYWDSLAANFYELSVPPGDHTVKIQWKKSLAAGYTYVETRTLNIIALPA